VSRNEVGINRPTCDEWCIASTGGGKSSGDRRVQGRLDGVVNALLLVSLPLWFYVAVHFQSLLKWEHFWSVLILGAAPWCLLSMLEGDCDRFAAQNACLCQHFSGHILRYSMSRLGVRMQSPLTNRPKQSFATSCRWLVVALGQA
jgi:hypothetical protein